MYFPLKHSCRYNKKNIARRLEDMNFLIFLYHKHYVTRCARSKNIVLPLKNKIHIFVSPCNIPSFVHAKYPDIFWCSNECIQLGTIDHKKTGTSSCHVMVANMKESLSTARLCARKKNYSNVQGTCVQLSTKP